MITYNNQNGTTSKRAPWVMQLAVIATLCGGRFAYGMEASQEQHPYRTVHSFNEVPWHEFDKDTLVLFDVDNVLVYNKDALARDETDEFYESFRAVIREHDQELYDNYEKFRYHLARLLRDVERDIIEPKVAQVISSLREKGVTVMALTALFTASGLTYCPKKRADFLAEFGIQFTQDHGNKVFDMLEKDEHRHPELYRGILFGKQKGAILRTFLDMHNLQFKRIVFFDDKLSNLKMIEQLCAERGIKSRLYHYFGHHKIPVIRNEERERKQVEILVWEHRWLSDAEVDQRLKAERTHATDSSEETRGKYTASERALHIDATGVSA